MPEFAAKLLCTPEGPGSGGTLTQTRQVAFAMQKSRRTEKKDTEIGMDSLELKTEENIKVFKGACIEAEVKENMPVISDKVGTKTYKFCAK